MGDYPGAQPSAGKPGAPPPGFKPPDDPFAPLPARDELDRPNEEDEVWRPELPTSQAIPALENVTWPKFGSAVWSWPYRDAAGALLFVVMRFERTKPDGTVQKETIPYTYGFREWTTKAGKRLRKTQWHAKRPCVPVPLYGLDRLAARVDAPVVLVEGEKTADAGVEVFRDYVVICSQGGSNGAAKADWTPLAGRTVIVWPDNDLAGRKYAKAAKAALIEADAADVCVVDVPEEWPDGWDVADPVPGGGSPNGLMEMIADARKAAADPEAQTSEFRAAEIERLSKLSGIDYQTLRKDAASSLGIGVTSLDKLVKAIKARRHAEAAAEFRSRPDPELGETMWPMGFRMKRDGLYMESDGDAPDIWICPPFQVLGQGRDGQGEGWGLWLEWSDPDRRVHRWAMPSRLLMVGPGELEGELVNRGLQVSADPAARALLRKALSEVKSGSRVVTVDQPGWHAAGAGSPAYILADGSLIGAAEEHVVLRSVPEAASLMTAQSGDLEGWKRHVAAKAAGNTVAVFCISLAFAGTMADMLSEPSGGFHIYGKSKIGKTMAAAMAVSVFGSTRKGGILRDWRSTSNGMELAASDSNDCLLVLDEIHQVEPRDLVQAVYMLANEGGKARARRDISSAKKKTWRVLVLSTGEVDVASVAAKAGSTLPAGAHVRLPSLPVDASMWKDLHGHDEIRDLMAHLHGAMRQQHGTAGRAFLELLARKRETEIDELLDAAEAMRERFSRLIPGADAQVHDVARRCALIAFAGELAVAWGILPWKQDEAFAAAKAMLSLWIQQRGGRGTTEESQHLRMIRLFLVEHGAARFVRIRKNVSTNGQWEIAHPDRPVTNRAGWVHQMSDGRDEYLIDPDVWKNVCTLAQADSSEVGSTLKKAGFLETSASEKHLAMKRTIPGLGKARVYVVLPGLLGETEKTPGPTAGPT